MSQLGKDGSNPSHGLLDFRVVVKRAPVPVPARGQLAQPRRKNFKWTQDMTNWFAKATGGMSRKAIAFQELRNEAEGLWGTDAPEVEHMMGRINNRDTKQRKEAAAALATLATLTAVERDTTLTLPGE